MKKYFLFSILICLFLIQGCASGQWITIHPNDPVPCQGKKTSDIYVKNYTIGEKKVAYIGQEIIRVKEYTRESGEFINNFTALKDITIDAKYSPTNKYQISIEANREYQTNKTIIISGKIYYLITVPDKKNGQWGILISCDGKIFANAIYSFDNEMLFYQGIISFTPDLLNIKTIVQKEIKDIKVTPGMMYELIYSGKNDVSLNATYREYSSDDLARPAFFQNLTYQANAKQIRFKDFVIQIHNVTNEQITYTVLEDGLK